jgi:hypothetical protein
MTPDKPTECIGCRAAVRIGLNPALCDVHLTEQRAAAVRKQEETHDALVQCAAILRKWYDAETGFAEMPSLDEIDAALKRLEEIK